MKSSAIFIPFELKTQFPSTSTGVSAFSALIHTLHS
jgi:hypothetical protein